MTTAEERLSRENELLRATVEEMRARVHEPEEIVRAIRQGEVDAFVVAEPKGERIYSLRSADLLYRAMIENMKEGAVVLDTAGTILYSNPYFVELMKGQRSSLIGRRILSFVTPDDQSFFGALEQHSPTGVSRQELTLCCEDGELIPVFATLNRIEQQGGDIFCVILADLRAQRREAELLVESRRKDEFVAVLAHELRNPLAPIRYALESLRRTKRPTAERLEHAEGVIDRQLKQLTRLVDDLLDVSRITRGTIELQLEPLSVDMAIARAVESTKPLIEARHQELTVELSAGQARVHADAARLSQVISNLLANAAKFTPLGGHIWLEVAAQGGWAVVTVRDDGIGMKKTLLPEIFNLFSQGDATQERAQGGLGIGLTVVKNLVEMHGGTVQAKSEGPGKGSEFVIRLPLLDEVSDAAGAGARPDPSGPSEDVPKRILIVDDNVDVSESFMQWLQDRGHEVRIAGDGESALKDAPDFRPDIIFVDIGLPGIDGHATARAMRRMPELKQSLLVALTGYGQDKDRIASEQAGFDQHWVKPVTSETLDTLLAPSE